MFFYNCHTHQHELGAISIFNSNTSTNNTVHSIGIHPWQTVSEQFDYKSIKFLATANKCIAIGEIGIDKIKGADLLTQLRFFEQQVLIAEELQLPVIIHCVKAWNEIKQIKQKVRPQQPWIFHGFNKISLLRDVINEGLMISLGATLFDSKWNTTILDQIPLHQLLFETDDKKINISSIYQQYSLLSGISLLDLNTIIEQNFKNTFKKWQIGLNEQN